MPLWRPSRGCSSRGMALPVLGGEELLRKVVQVALVLTTASPVMAPCPPRWIPYREELCLYLPASPALSWDEARVFCQDQNAQLVVIKDHNKQMFLMDLADGARGHASHYWIGLAWEEASAQLTWLDGTPASQSWYSNWLPGHPKKEHCVQFVGIYTGQWRDWDCSTNSAFICETPVKDAFPGSVRKVRFRSHCYAFHFPSFREWRSWREAQALCQESGEGLAIIHGPEENAFLSDAFPEEGWHMWIGLRFGTSWKWSDSSPLDYFWWHPEKAPSRLRDQCAMLSLQPTDAAQHGAWKTRPCGVRPTSEIIGFICQHRDDFCGPPKLACFPLPGGLGQHATADITFSLSAHSVCFLSLTGLQGNNTLFWLNLHANGTQVHGSILSELGGFSVHKNFPRMSFLPGLNTWTFVTYPDGVASFFNHQEHFRLSGAQGISFAHLSSLQITGVTVANASLEYGLSSELSFPGGSGLQLENAIQQYLGNFTIGLWLRSSATHAPKMCLVSYSLKWRRSEFALFLLSPSGLEFHIKGVTMFSSTHGFLLDGSWHHLAVSVSNTPGLPPFEVFVDGEPWEPYSATSASIFLWRGLSLGGKLSVGQLEVDSRGTSFYKGDLSEVNLWDRVLLGHSVKQLAASRTKWKYPGNVVSWAQLVAKKPPPLKILTPSSEPEAAFVWFGLFRLRGKRSVLCADSEQLLVYVTPLLAQCPNRAFWGLQLNGRLRNVANPPSCLLVAMDGVSLEISWDCSADAKHSFRLLPDQRLQNLLSGTCVFQDVIHASLFLGKCTPQAMYFALDWDVHCPQSLGWRSWKDKCLFLVLDVALEWSRALTYCQRFHGGSLLTLSSPQDLVWLQEELQVSVWTGLRSSSRRDLLSWADQSPFNAALQRFIFSWGPSGGTVCMLALSTGFLKAEPCHRPHRWICQASHRSDLYVTFPGRSFYGALSADLSFPSLQEAQRQCSALGKGCDVVVSTSAGHQLSLGRRFVTLEGPAAADPSAAIHVKSRCSPGYSGQDCQSMCPPCEPRLSCNPLTGCCDGFLHYRQAPAVVYSLKCLPLESWVYEHGACLSSEHYSRREEAAAICQRYLGATVRKVRHPLQKAPVGSSGTQGGDLKPSGFLWACQRMEDVELPSFREKLLVSLWDTTPHQRHALLQEARDACYLQKEGCGGVLSLDGAHYTVAGTVLVDSPGSGALLYIKTGCSRGFCGERCQRTCSPCLSTRVYNPLTGHCDGLLRCIRHSGPLCLYGLVNSRCPQGPGWWFWNGHCYYVEKHSSKDWQGAKAACRVYGKDVSLLTLSSAKEKAWVAAMVQKDSWTGLNDADGDRTWTWAEGQAAHLPLPWLADVQLTTGDCLEIKLQTKQNLAVSHCSEHKAWVCKGTWGHQSSCPTEPGWRQWNGSCYFLDVLSVSGWHEARDACRRFRNTELLYLTSLQERDWVRSNFQGSVWTGLNDLQEESVFRWTTQEPLSEHVAQYLQDDMADGGLKDCVWLDLASGLLRDANCEEARPFLCKGSEATDWFEERPGLSVVKGDPAQLFPSARSLDQAKQECLQERHVCVAVLRSGSGFYLISSMDRIVSKPDSVLYVWTICAEGFSGLDCRRASERPSRPACDCSGRFQTTAEKVCGVLVRTCVDDCRRLTAWSNCSLCLPVCTEASLSLLDPEEVALITMIQFKVSHSLNLTEEDERDQRNSSKIIYDTKYP
ncbi:uncharacterized protein LOC121936433 [Sceloporus undulatus]|uniref:uncharacterized protein LOC121936433 n=1 Tax=Sceloporus undulatus TaxID=8520 RepID=UPI001C4B06ED|nr:uncharacterized protein LOC121936433 [Sceloporus undulatus]